MTQPKFPWVLLLIIGMFTFVAVSAPTLWILVFAIIAVAVSSAAAIYQVIPRKDDTIEVQPKPGEETPPDDFVDPWATKPEKPDDEA